MCDKELYQRYNQETTTEIWEQLISLSNQEVPNNSPPSSSHPSYNVIQISNVAEGSMVIWL